MKAFIFLTIISFTFICILADNSLTEQTQPTTQPLQSHLPQVQQIKMTFSQFKQLYGKKYSSVAEQNYRRYIFYQNLQKLNRHHKNQSRLYNMKPNQFLDVTSTEFKQTFTGAYQSNQHSKNVSNCYLKEKRKNRQNNSSQTKKNKKNRGNSTNTSTYSNRQLEQIQNEQAIIPSTQDTQNISETAIAFTPPTNFQIDWSLYSGSIKYQGICGACYAFSAVDTLAAANAIHRYGFFVPLSVQQILDCPNNKLTFGCSGGYLEGAFSHIQLYGVTTEQQYPYQSTTSGKQQACKQIGGPFKLSSFNSIKSGDCQSILNSLALGPVSAGIAGYTLQFYDTGIFNDCNQVLDHAVVIVGYRSGMGWKIKNSWGLRWGQEGYGWIGEGNTCGICNMAVTVAL